MNLYRVFYIPKKVTSYSNIESVEVLAHSQERSIELIADEDYVKEIVSSERQFSRPY